VKSVYQKAVNLARRAARKPLRVVAIRARQELRLQLMHYSRAWRRLERSITKWWTEERLLRYLYSSQGRFICVAPDAVHALQTAINKGWLSKEALLAYGESMRSRKFELMGAAVPHQGTFPWSTDWCWNKTWEPAYFKRYNFYGPRDRPYDVKRPWELARLGFVLPMLQNAAIDPDGAWVESAIRIIESWERDNPLAYTVVWNPMEASVRGIYLVLALEMLRCMNESRAEVILPVLRLISSHGEFVWNNVEYTDIRGNHYAANIVFLLLAGLVLRNEYPNARRWVRYASRVIPEEIKLQFLPDGVNFEKTVAYHRLVTELFLIAVLAMEREGLPIPAEAKDRLCSACLYSAAYMRPDGLSPNVGDNDDARILCLDPVDLRDHRPLISVGAAYFVEPQLKISSGVTAGLSWLLGCKGISTWEKLEAVAGPEITHFPVGGVVIVRRSNSFLFMDVGEVGLAGRGGHGHNDILSFEYIADGIPLVVDPGSYVYTGDEEARNLFRSSAYHNILRIDQMEVAPMSGMWGISNVATPRDVSVVTNGGTVIISGAHSGYLRLDDPVLHTRELRLSENLEVVECIDILECKGVHLSERFLHVDHGIRVVLNWDHAVLITADRKWTVTWDNNTEARLEMGWVSPSYGRRREAPILVLRDKITGPSVLRFRISPVS
jgi:hypothetical protein